MDTRSSILNAAVQVFAQHGFRGSTTRRIADAAEVNEVTIFRYFGSKDALLEEAIFECAGTPFSTPLPLEPKDPPAELGEWCTGVMSALHLRGPVIRKCMGEMEERPQFTSCAAEAPTLATNEVSSYLERLKAAGFTNEDFDPAVASSMLMGALFHDAMGRDMMPDIYPKPLSEAPSRYARLILRAIGVAAAAVFAFAPIVSTAQAPQPAASNRTQALTLSLDDAVRMAEGQSEDVRVARAGAQRSEGQRLQARSQLFPQIFGSGGYTRTLKSQYSGFAAPAPDTTSTPAAPAPPCDVYLRDENATVAERLAGLEQSSRCASGLDPFSAFGSLPFGQANQYQVGLSFSQNLFTGGRVLAQTQAAAAGRRAADIELTARRAQIILDVTQAYYDAALADRLVAISDASFTQTENVLRQVQLNKSVGTVSEFELLRAQVTRDNQRPQVIQRRSDREVAYLRLKQLLNIPLEQPVALSTSIDEVGGLPAGIRMAGLSVTSFDAPDTTSANRAAVRQAGENVRAQQELLRVARSQRLPSLSLTSQYGAVAYPTGGLPGRSEFRTNWTVGISTQLPIFTAGRIRGEELVAQANLAESRARLQQVREFAALDARVALNALNQAMSAWEASRGTAEQAARAYTIAEVRYREGISTQLELNDSRILVEQATANRALAARNLQIARMKLALLPNLPLQTQSPAQAGAQTQFQQPSGQPAPQQMQPGQPQPAGQPGTLTSQQLPPGA